MNLFFWLIIAHCTHEKPQPLICRKRPRLRGLFLWLKQRFLYCPQKLDHGFFRIFYAYHAAKTVETFFMFAGYECGAEAFRFGRDVFDDTAGAVLLDDFLMREPAKAKFFQIFCSVCGVSFVISCSKAA